MSLEVMVKDASTEATTMSMNRATINGIWLPHCPGCQSRGGGRFNTFEYNTDLHQVYAPERDTWERLAPLPTARSGHGLVVYRDRLYAMGGEGGIINRPGQQTVFGQMESYDPATNTWQSHAAMPIPRHAVAAVTIGDWIYVAGGGAVLGGSVQSAVHEAFSLSGV